MQAFQVERSPLRVWFFAVQRHEASSRLAWIPPGKLGTFSSSCGAHATPAEFPRASRTLFHGTKTNNRCILILILSETVRVFWRIETETIKATVMVTARVWVTVEARVNARDHGHRQ